MPEELFAEVNAILDSGSRTSAGVPRRKNHVYALSGRVRCSACGRRLVAGWLRSHARYRCETLKTNREIVLDVPHDASPSVRETDLEQAIGTWLAAAFNKREMTRLAEEISAADAALGDTPAASQARRDKERLDAQFQNVVGSLRHATTDAARRVIAAEADRASAALEAADRRLARLERPRLALTPESVLSGLNAAGGLAEAVESAPVEMRRDLYEALGLEVDFDHQERSLVISVAPWGNTRVGGGT